MTTQKFKSSILTAITIIAASLSTQVLATDFVVVVSANSKIANLTAEQVSQIFLGKAGSFPSGEPAMPIDQAEGSSIRKNFYLQVSNKSVTQLAAYRANMVFSGKGRAPREISDNGVTKKLVADNPNVIAYIDKSTVDSSVKVVLTAP